MLEPLWPGVVGELADQAHQLAEDKASLLGERRYEPKRLRARLGKYWRLWHQARSA
jgi:hypothetical protein